MIKSRIALMTILAVSLCSISFAQGRSNSYGKNLLTVAPVVITDQGVGFGLSYERSLDGKGMFSFYLPLAYSFRVQEDNYFWGPGGYNKTEYMAYAYPGVKIYPTGAFGKVRYGIGPSLVLGVGEQYDNSYYSGYPDIIVYPPYPGSSNPAYVSRFVLGAMVNNSLNINPTERLYLGMELGLGVTYMNKWDNWNGRTQPLVQAAFRIGYRF